MKFNITELTVVDTIDVDFQEYTHVYGNAYYYDQWNLAADLDEKLDFGEVDQRIWEQIKHDFQTIESLEDGSILYVNTVHYRDPGAYYWDGGHLVEITYETVEEVVLNSLPSEEEVADIYFDSFEEYKQVHSDLWDRIHSGVEHRVDTILDNREVETLSEMETELENYLSDYLGEAVEVVR